MRKPAPQDFTTIPIGTTSFKILPAGATDSVYRFRDALDPNLTVLGKPIPEPETDKGVLSRS